MRVDPGISDRLMNYVRQVLPLETGWGPERYRATNFARGGNNDNYFDFELNFVLDGNEIDYGDPYDPEDPADVERYFALYAGLLKDVVVDTAIQYELISETGEE